MPRGTGHGQVKGLSSTYSKDGKGNRFRYQNFGERVAKAKFEARVAPRIRNRKNQKNEIAHIISPMQSITFIRSACRV